MGLWTRRFARLVLERCHGNRSRACAELGISYHTLKTYLDGPAESDPAYTGPSAVAGISATIDETVAMP